MLAIKIFIGIILVTGIIETGCFLYLHFTKQLSDDDYNIPLGG